MPSNYEKIETPTEDSVVLGGRTLKQIVSIMDRLEGILEIVDVPSATNHRRSIFTRRTHAHFRSPEDHQWSMQHLLCFDNLYFIGNKLRPNGWSVWDMYIAHHFTPYTPRPKRGPIITSKNLGEFVKKGRIAYVIAPHRDVSKDLDALESFIAKCDERLATIGEWVRLDLCMVVRCACGRGTYVNARDRFHVIPAQRTTFDVVKKMRCTVCGASDVRSTAAYYRDCYSEFWKYSRRSFSQSPRKLKNSLDELYVNAAGDGENPAYLGDGLYVDPDGTLHE